MDGDYGRLFYLVLLLMAVGGWVVVEYRQRLGQALRVGLAWGLIFLGVVAGYGMWGDIRHRITPSQSLTGQNEITLPRAADGHFYAELVIDGTEVFFLVDTGATITALSDDAAAAAGIRPDPLRLPVSVRTANGEVEARMARVGELRPSAPTSSGARRSRPSSSRMRTPLSSRTVSTARAGISSSISGQSRAAACSAARSWRFSNM